VSQHSQMVTTAAVSVSVLFLFKSIFQRFKGGKKDSRAPQIRKTMDSLVEFLSMPYLGPRVTIEKFCNLAGPALGGVAYYYSVPYGPGSGDKVEIYNEIGIGIQLAITRQKTEKLEPAANKMRLVASSKSCTFRANPPQEFCEAFSTALNGSASKKDEVLYVKTYSNDVAKDRHLAAAVVRAHGPHSDTHGVFLMVGPTSMTEDMSLDMSSAAQAWASVLNGRLERVREMALINEHETTSQLYAIGAKMAQQTKISKIEEMMSDSMAKVMNVSKATLWFIDEERGEIWTLPKADFPKGQIQQFDTGIVGHVASRYNSEKDFHQSIICANDPASMPSWTEEVANSENPSFKTQNLLTVPVLDKEHTTGGDTGRILVAVLQLTNKTSKTDLEDSVGFTEADIRLVEVCSDILGDEIARLTVDILASKANIDFDKVGRSGARVSFLTEYYKLEGIVPKIEKQKAGKDKIRRSVVPQASSFGGVDIKKWGIDYWNLSEAEEFQVLVQGLERLSVPTASLDIMSRFFQRVKHGYKDNPYHNFHHAIATVHYSFLLVQASKMEQCLRLSEKFALLVGALCHDVDHRGYNTAFEVATRSELAMRYNDCSPLENHHCAKTFQLALNDGGDFGDCNIFRDMSSDFYQPMRKTMVKAILGTDMLFHGDHVKGAQKFEPAAEQQDQHPEIGVKGTFIVELMMHTADIANPFMPRDISQRWSIHLCAEFSKQVEAERRLEIPVTPFMDGVTTALGRAKSGLGFAEYVVCPLMNPLFKLFEGWYPAKGYLQENRQFLSDFIESAKLGEEFKVPAESEACRKVSTTSDLTMIMEGEGARRESALSLETASSVSSKDDSP